REPKASADQRREPKASLDPFHDRVGARPPLLLACPDRTFRRTSGERIQVLTACGCGEVGMPAPLVWTGDCCGPCHDRRQEGRAEREAPAVLDAGGEVEKVAVAADGSTVAALTRAGGLRAWRAADGAPLPVPPRATQDGFRRVLALSPDGRRLAVGLGSERIGLV